MQDLGITQLPSACSSPSEVDHAALGSATCFGDSTFRMVDKARW